MLQFGLYSGRAYLGFGFCSGKNRIGLKSGMIRFGFVLSIFGSLRVGSLWIGFELGGVISGVGHFNSCYNSGWLWIGLLRVFGSKSVHPILGVGLGMDLDCLVWVSSLTQFCQV